MIMDKNKLSNKELEQVSGGNDPAESIVYLEYTCEKCGHVVFSCPKGDSSQPYPTEITECPNCHAQYSFIWKENRV